MLYLGRGGGWDMLFLKSTTYLLVVVNDALILFVLIVALILYAHSTPPLSTPRHQVYTIYTPLYTPCLHRVQFNVGAVLPLRPLPALTAAQNDVAFHPIQNGADQSKHQTERAPPRLQ